MNRELGQSIAMKKPAACPIAVCLMAALGMLHCRPTCSAAEAPAPLPGSQPPLPVAVSVSHGPQHPSSVPVLPGLFVGRQIYYADGHVQLHPMIPPYTMPSVVGNICPRAQAVPIGQLTGNAGPVADTQAYLSLTDVVLDPSKPMTAIELRCVATETLLGVAGATLLDAR